MIRTRSNESGALNLERLEIASSLLQWLSAGMTVPDRLYTHELELQVQQMLLNLKFKNVHVSESSVQTNGRIHLDIVVELDSGSVVSSDVVFRLSS